MCPLREVSDQVIHKLGCTTTEDGYRLETSDFIGSRGINCAINVVKTKVLIS